jgi:hypothetical protein
MLSTILWIKRGARAPKLMKRVYNTKFKTKLAFLAIVGHP